MGWGWLFTAQHQGGRWIVQHLIGLCYAVAFTVTINQGRALIGVRGLTPAPEYLRSVPFLRRPSLFQLRYGDRLLLTVAWIGLALSLAALAGVIDLLPVAAGIGLWLVTWVLYLSIVNVGQQWYGFGWESLLLEAGFLTAFLGPSAMPAPEPILWLLLWLLFRVEFGAGLIKLRGDSCWRDLTCLYYHHETQPMPNPLSWYFHRLPKPLHRVEVAANHVTQLIVPFGLFAPQPYATVAAAIVIVTQFWLILSGNFAWLNWITAILATSVVDWRALGLPGLPRPTAEPVWHQALVIAVTALVVVLSYWPARNLISRRQRMNASFNPLHLVNSYGAFGSITKTRFEVVIEGTEDPEPGPDSEWREYEFNGKPGDPRRRPRQFAPYHLRLDWMMWFAGLSSLYAEPWMVPLAEKLLENDPATLRLLRLNPFPDTPPAVVRARLYRYRFTTWRERRETGAWWDRRLVREYLPPIGLRPTAGATR
jgi:Lipase maturation factor